MGSSKIIDRAKIVKDYQVNEKDSGSSEVQVAILSNRISHLTEHLKKHKKDNHSRRGLMLMVSRRNRLLGYLRKSNVDRYKTLIERLGLRK